MSEYISPIDLHKVWLNSLRTHHPFWPPSDIEWIGEFTEKVPNMDDQLRYVIETNKFISSEVFDPNYTLVSRRTLPKTSPLPEPYWIPFVNTVLYFYDTEIRGPHRLWSVILCTTYTNLSRDGSIKPDQRSRLHAIEVTHRSYNQRRALFRFRPQKQQQELDRYLQNGGLSLEGITQKVIELKRRGYSF